MKKRLIIVSFAAALLMLSLFLSGCINNKNVGTQTEEIDKSTRLNTQTFTGNEGNYTVGQLEYIKDAKLYSVYFDTNLRTALDWLHANSRPDEKVFSWWDNGHMIRGYARREPVAYTPCYEILSTVSKGKWDVNKLGALSTKEDMTNIAYGFLADSPTITRGIMTRYGAKYAFVTANDPQKIGGMVILMGEDVKNYLNELNEPKDTVKQKILFKMADGAAVKGFEMVYQDNYAHIYRVSD